MKIIVFAIFNIVVPLAGTWIETDWVKAFSPHDVSFPLRERGLKRHNEHKHTGTGTVVPLAGTWIETLSFPMPAKRL